MGNIIDEKDRKILELLEKHAEYTTRQIAKKIQVPITTVHHRIKKMKKEGIIRKFTIIPDYDAVGKGFLVYVLIHAGLPLLKQKKKTQYDIAKEINMFPQVERVDVITGGADLIAVVRVKDVREFDQFLLGKLQLVEGVEKTQSMIAIH